ERKDNNSADQIASLPFIVLSASSNGADINPKVKRFLHLKPKREKGPFIYRRGDIDTYRTEESDVGTKLAHLSRNTVSIFRDLSDTDETRVTFILYPPDLPKEII
ncbi:hypothetical protein N7475_007752, partial [Penicillium sp. IBT 31633x]